MGVDRNPLQGKMHWDATRRGRWIGFGVDLNPACGGKLRNPRVVSFPRIGSERSPYSNGVVAPGSLPLAGPRIPTPGATSTAPYSRAGAGSSSSPMLASG